MIIRSSLLTIKLNLNCCDNLFSYKKFMDSSLNISTASKLKNKVTLGYENNIYYYPVIYDLCS